MLSLLLAHLDLFPLLAENLPAHFQHSLEAFSSSFRILAEALHACFLDLRLDLLPSAAQRYNLRFLHELRLPHRIGGERLIDNGFPALQQVRPGHIRAAHGDLFRLRIYVGDLVDV